MAIVKNRLYLILILKISLFLKNIFPISFVTNILPNLVTEHVTNSIMPIKVSIFVYSYVCYTTFHHVLLLPKKLQHQPGMIFSSKITTQYNNDLE